MFAASVAAAPGSGELTPAISTPTGTANLTAEGLADWVHWGKDSAGSLNRKAGVAGQIGALTTLGGSASRFLDDPVRLRYSWSDGAPTPSATTQAGLYIAGLNKGFELRAPADTSERTLVLYLGGWKARGRIEVGLSDDSAPDFVQTVEDLAGPFDRRLALSYRAASAGQTLLVRYTQTTTSGNITVQAATLQGGGVPSFAWPFHEDFSDGDMSGWLVADQTSLASQWGVSSGSLQQTQRVESTASFDQSYHLGSFAYLAAGIGLTDYRFRAELEPLAQDYADDIGIVFRYLNANNFYRLSVNGRYGFTRLEKRLNGVFTPLATDSRGYTWGEVLNLEVEVRGSRILVWRQCGRIADPLCLDNEPLFAVEDGSLAAGTVGLYTQHRARFDNVRVDPPSTAPAIILSSPWAHSTTSGTLINAAAQVLNAPSGATVEFSLNDGNGVADSVAPYEVEFSGVAPGSYTLDAVVYSASGVELARDTNGSVGVGGEYFVGIGDSITNGEGDNYADNESYSGRVVGVQGYQAGLTDLLDATAGLPNQLVFNEGIGGDRSTLAANSRVDSILARHPNMDTALIQLGTNDAGWLIPSGLGCSGTSCNGTFKGNMQLLTGKLAAAGVAPIVARPPPGWTSTVPWTSAFNNRIREYNAVIETELDGIASGPDFFGFFMPSSTENYRSLFADTLHPNGLGYRLMSYLWHNALVQPGSQRALPFVLRNLSAATGALVQQNLLQAGNTYYIDDAVRLVTAPSLLTQQGRWVMTANADRNATATNYLTFALDRAADVYVAYDAAVAPDDLPDWLKETSGFVDTPEPELDVVATTNANHSSLKLYRKGFTSGTVVTLGGNSGSTTGAGVNYVVIVVEKP